ncbi:MAG: ATP-dependent RNA helicase HrpA [Gammaproteobacteria bacterium]|nr:ATP-dependent RNA helicase HrpA [Gammaproteobacteria bacterium]
MLSDRQAIRNRLKGLRRRASEGKPYDQGLDKILEQIEGSSRRAVSRRELLPSPEFPPDLPISERRTEIAKLIDHHQVIILCGETGSGKSTQLPKICLSLGRGVFGRIGHTQPRRIAARSLASRISSELGVELGTSVGYKVRFHDRVGPQSHVKLMTDGMLLAEIQRDRYLNEYDTLIIDEAHERSLNIDFLLGYLRQLLPKRPDLKLIITSATIDPERFSSHFGDAPIINVSGRTYPVELRYRPPEEEGGSERDDAIQQSILDAVDELSGKDRGDILVFLSGEREIRETAENLRKHKMALTEVLPLYARLGPGEQGRIFKPGGQRRIILATNVAETSLTVPGIRYVIDAGFARISRYSHRSKVQRLPVERVAQASANQRKGRCGRVSEGICIRLYSEEDFESRPEFTEPEVQRTNLASVILQMKLLGFGDIDAFPFVDPPDSRLIKDGYRVLEEIGAVDGLRQVTRLGRQLSRLPVDPRIARMLFAAAHEGCLKEVQVIAAALSVQDPRDRPIDKRQEADQAHALFVEETSDFLGYLKLWDFLEEKRRHLTKRKFRVLCRGHFLSWTRVQEWHDIHHQIRGQMHEMGLKENEEDAGHDPIHMAILSGLLSHVGFKGSGKDREYLGARNSRFSIFPGSALFKGQPKWVMASELVETSKLYARTVAKIEPEWIESLAGHLIRRSYSEPHWQKRRGQVGGYERVTLFGITLVPRRRINYGPLKPEESREIFIRFALVEGDFDTRGPFWRHNKELIAHVEHLEHKSRRRDLMVDQESLYEFYDKRIPEGIYSTPQFESWLRKATSDEPKLLHMREDDLMNRDAGLSDYDFPDQLDLGGLLLPLKYQFDPGNQRDGVTLKIPLMALNQVSEARCQWLVPGLLRERVVTLMRGLPKGVRKLIVPVPDYADACLKELEPTDKPLQLALSEKLEQLVGVHIPEDAWPEASLPNHLRMNYQVVNEKGKIVDSGRDLQQLKQRHRGKQASQPVPLQEPGLEQRGLIDWPVGELAESIELNRGGIKLRGFPALVDEGESVALKVLDSRSNAEREHRAGVRRLIMLKLAKDMRYLKRNLNGLEKFRLQYAKVPKPPKDLRGGKLPGLEQELVALILDHTFLKDAPEIRDETAFIERLEERKGELMTEAGQVMKRVQQIFDRYQKLRKALAGSTQINWMDSLADMNEQLDSLVYRGFLLQVPYEQLRHYPRYLQALEKRLEKLTHAASRDRQALRQMAPLYREWQKRESRYRQEGRVDERIDALRWMFEELRVSLFAQELKTAYPVSLKRIEKYWWEMKL